MTAEAAVRVRHMRSMLEAVEHVGAAEAIEASVGPETIRDIRESVVLGWLPMEVNVEITHAVRRILGPRRACDVFRAMVLREYQTSLFKPMIDSARRLMGLTPGTFVKLAPKGWGLVFRNVGSPEPRDIAATEARLRISDLAPACVHDDVWIQAVRCSFTTAFDLTNTRGEVTIENADLERRSVEYVFRWSTRFSTSPPLR